jgi:tRNA uridine 5-carbamoylmethylation protein Kti12
VKVVEALVPEVVRYVDQSINTIRHIITNHRLAMPSTLPTQQFQQRQQLPNLRRMQREFITIPARMVVQVVPDLLPHVLLAGRRWCTIPLIIAIR